ncbi:hypothetical protein FAVG1_00441 [Fusarium avenaceum]|nr:hypothetical protein FAVG1_00441 [Fusarium avenaceum]
MGINHFRSQKARSNQSFPRRLRAKIVHFHGKLYSTREVLLEGTTDPVNQHWRYNHHIAALFSDDEWRSSFENLCENSEDESCCDAQSEYTADSALPRGANLLLARELLIPRALDHFRAFLTTAECINAPVHKILFMGYDGKSTCSPMIPNRTRNFDQNNAEPLLQLSPTKRQQSFKCPFYAFDSIEYRHCLIGHDLRSPKSVLRHATRDHAKPPYCPRCSQTFDTVVQCDQHIIDRGCVTRGLVQPDGLNFSQRRRLRLTDDPQLTDEQRWEQIYMLIFPKSDCLPSPYLDTGCERTISIAREFWQIHGHDCVADLLQSDSRVQIEGKRAKRVLYDMGLEDLIGKLALDGI